MSIKNFNESILIEGWLWCEQSILVGIYGPQIESMNLSLISTGVKSIIGAFEFPGSVL